MARPADIRAPIVQALRTHGPLTLHQLARLPGVGLTTQTLKRGVLNAVHTHHVQVVGRARQEHCKKWVRIYEAVDPTEQDPQEPTHLEGHVLLGSVINEGWR